MKSYYITFLFVVEKQVFRLYILSHSPWAAAAAITNQVSERPFALINVFRMEKEFFSKQRNNDDDDDCGSERERDDKMN